MKQTTFFIGTAMVVILLVVSAGCANSSTGSSSSTTTPASVTSQTVPATPTQPGSVTVSTPLMTSAAAGTTGTGLVATKGDLVSVFYTGAFENGTVFDTNMDNTTPSTFTLGGSGVIPGIENAVTGMSVNQVKTVAIPYDQGYGAYNPALVHTVSRTGPIADTQFTVGQTFVIHDQTTNKYSSVKILAVTPTTVTWDENNPFAGQNFTFTIKLAGITRP